MRRKPLLTQAKKCILRGLYLKFTPKFFLKHDTFFFIFKFFLEKIIFFQQKIKIFQNQDLSKYIVQLSVLIDDQFFLAGRGLEGKRHVPSFFLFDFVPKYKVKTVRYEPQF